MNSLSLNIQAVQVVMLVYAFTRHPAFHAVPRNHDAVVCTQLRRRHLYSVVQFLTDDAYSSLDVLVTCYTPRHYLNKEQSSYQLKRCSNTDSTR